MIHQTVDFPIRGIAGSTVTSRGYTQVSDDTGFSQARRVGWEFYDLLRDVQEVEHIVVSESENIFFVYTIVNKVSREVAHQIYDRELQLVDQFPMTHFDFNLIRRRGRPLEDLFTRSETDVFLSVG